MPRGSSSRARAVVEPVPWPVAVLVRSVSVEPPHRASPGAPPRERLGGCPIKVPIRCGKSISPSPSGVDVAQRQRGFAPSRSDKTGRPRRARPSSRARAVVAPRRAARAVCSDGRRARAGCFRRTPSPGFARSSPEGAVWLCFSGWVLHEASLSFAGGGDVAQRQSRGDSCHKPARGARRDGRMTQRRIRRRASRRGALGWSSSRARAVRYPDARGSIVTVTETPRVRS
jgi:hypothetical protein